MVYTEYLDLRTPNIWTLILIVVFVPPFTIALATCQNELILYVLNNCVESAFSKENTYI
jgi:hypothetical protein